MLNKIRTVLKKKDILDAIVNARKQQQEIDATFWKNHYANETEKLKSKYELEKQELNAHIKMLTEQMVVYKEKDKHVTKKEFFLKKQSNENFIVASKISDKIREFGEQILQIVGEVEGISEQAEEQKKKVESQKLIQ